MRRVYSPTISRKRKDNEETKHELGPRVEEFGYETEMSTREGFLWKEEGQRKKLRKSLSLSNAYEESHHPQSPENGCH